MTEVIYRPLQNRRNWRGKMRAQIRTKSLKSWAAFNNWRTYLLFLVFHSAFLVLVVKIVMVSGSSTAITDVSQSINTSTANEHWSTRASIVDRNGVVLAANMASRSLYVQPNEMSNNASRRRVATELATLFPELDADDLFASFSNGSSFRWVKKRLTPEQQQAVHDVGEPGLHLGPREVRIYPQGRIAAHLLGNVSDGYSDAQSVELKGTAGVEMAKDRLLQQLGKQNLPLELSIDLRAQAILSDTLTAAIHTYKAEGGSAVLMDANSGEIIALVSLPDYDPNLWAEIFSGTPEQRKVLFCQASQGLYEFGSTFKIFAAAQALELGLVDIDSEVPNQDIKLGKYTISRYDTDESYLSVEDVIAKSSNVGSAWLALQIGSERQRQFMKELGLLDPSGIETNEAQNLFPMAPSNWGDIQTATISYGHGLSVSQVHLAAAYSTIVNGGMRVRPTIIKNNQPTSEPYRVISSETSKKVTKLLQAVATKGTAKTSKPNGYSWGGKTGTADKPSVGGYAEDQVLATFASVFPIENPRFTLVVTLDNADSEDGTKWSRAASRTAVPTTAILISELAPLLGIRPIPQSPDQVQN